VSNHPLRRSAAKFAAFSLMTMGLIFATGCGDGEPKAEVSGTVTLDGVPIENGSIQFYPTGKTGQTAGGGIEKGIYKVEASPGEMTVTLNATKVVGKFKAYDTPESPFLDKVVEVIPPDYNSLSKIKVTLKPGKNENVNFDLESKKKK
jgi:hypothetical protein